MHSANNKRAKIAVLADQAVVSGSAILTQLLVVRGAGLQDYGIYAAAALAQLFVLSLQQAGISGMYMVIAPSLGEKERSRYRSGMAGLLIAGGGLIAVAALALYPLFSAHITATNWALMAASIILATLQDGARRVLVADAQYSKALATDSINNGLQLLGLGLLVVTGQATLQTVLLACAASFVPALVYATLVLKPSPGTKDALYVLHTNGKESVWMTASALLQWFAGNFYLVAAGWWLGTATLAVLRLGQYAFGFFNVALQAVENYVLPKAGALTERPEQMLQYLKQMATRLVPAAGLLLILTALVAMPVIQWLQPANTTDLTTVLCGLCGLYVLVTIGYPVRIALRSLKHSNVFFKGYVLSAVTALATAWLLIKGWQLAGVMTGLLLTQTITLTYWAGILQKKYKAIWK